MRAFFSRSLLALSLLVAACGGSDTATPHDMTPSCGTPLTLCGTACVDTARDVAHCGACGMACPVGNTCTAGKCAIACPKGEVVCGEKCVDTTSDPANCGACGMGCPDGNVCSSSKCAVSCQTGLTQCGGACVDPQTSSANCDACGKSCPPGSGCVRGQCALSCQSGLTACPASSGGGNVCVDTMRDDAHCGGCGTACPSGTVCQAGACTLTCQSGLTACPSSSGASDGGGSDGGAAVCVDTMRDDANCGACGMACPAGSVCSLGACVLSCQSGLTACPASSGASDGGASDGGVSDGGVSDGGGSDGGSSDGGTGNVCVDLTRDDANCGACGAACPSGTVCRGGQCATSCGPGLALCPASGGSDGGVGGSCVNLMADPANCGGCGRACPTNQLCSSGSCVVTCSGSLTACNMACIDPRFDPSNCGGCGKACPAVANAQPGCVQSTCTGYLCNAGFADCDGKSSTGCETATTADPANCGGCGKTCGAVANATPACVKSACSPSCATGYADCNKTYADGCEVNTQNDAKNCGGCNNACPSGQFCVLGACKSCNGNLLLLSDGNTAQNQQLAARLTAAGLAVTVVDHGAMTYAGTPAATNFGTIIVAPGDDYAKDMPAAGQNAIVAATMQATTGVLFTEWSAFNVTVGTYVTLNKIELLQRGMGTYGMLTFTSTAPHPIWTGLPASFTTTDVMGSNVGGALQNGGVAIASTSTGAQSNGAGVVVRDSNTGGRIVQMAHAANWTPLNSPSGGNDWAVDANMDLLMSNAAKWAARCM